MGAAISRSVSADRPGTAFEIPCFYAEFRVVRVAESSKEYSFWGIPGIPIGNVTKNIA